MATASCIIQFTEGRKRDAASPLDLLQSMQRCRGALRHAARVDIRLTL